jgi:hypothetical protein
MYAVYGYCFLAVSRAITKLKLGHTTVLMVATATLPIPGWNSSGKVGGCVVVAAGGKF